MFWRFGFSSVSTLETLLDKPNVTLEDVLDEDDVLQECKTANQKLMSFLQQPRIVKRLMEHVVGTATVGGTGGKEWEEKVKFKYPYVASEVLSCSEVWPIIDAIFSDPNEYLVPFWNAVLTSNPSPSQAPLPMHLHPLFAENTASSSSTGSSASTSPSPHPSVTNFTDFSNSASANAGSSRASSDSEAEGEGRLRATSALDNGPGRGVLAGYWAKVNGAYLERKPIEMLEFIKEQPRIVERFVAHLETPAVVDLLFRIIQMEETMRTPGQTTDIIDWLSSQDLIARTVDLLAPNYSVDIHNTVSELLKAIIALSAPSPAALNQGQGPELGGGLGDAQENAAGINNRLVRELASEPIVRKMVGYMLDSQLPRQLHRRLTDVADEQLSQLSVQDLRKPSQRRDASLSTLDENAVSGSALEDDDDDDESFARPLNPREFPASESRSPGQFDHRGSTATVRPDNLFPPVAAPTVPITAETCSSTLVTCIGVFIELIRKNNSDYFEQHLLRTLHNHLVKRQSELTEKRLKKKEDEEAAQAQTASQEGGTADSTQPEKQDDEESAQKAMDDLDEEEEDVQGMEEAMAEIVGKMGLVHLGPMLRVLSERLSDFQQLVNEPREREITVPTSVGDVAPLTFERYRITELYAELLHCSNMALLNRAAGEGPQYSADGVLTGGLEGLQTLARTLQGGDGPEVGDTSAGAEAEAVQETSRQDISPETNADAASENAAETGQLTPSRGSAHGRDKSSTGALTDSTDEADDEALLNEVSLGDKASSTTEAGSSLDAQSDAEKKSPYGGSPKVMTSDSLQEDKDDAASICSALSGLSLAELTAPRLSGPPSPIDEAKDYVVGDMLKRKFLECGILPSLLDLFFDYPWNNFLHNVVYDILQQCFNGRMDVGLNRKLTVAVFDQGHLTSRIVEGRKRNEVSVAGPRRIRLGYMGHMNLIAEETVKLLERYPLEIARPVEAFTERDEWRQVVSETLEEIREKEGGPLAFNRGHEGMSMSFGSDAEDDGDDGGIGGAGSSSFASYLSSQIGGATGSDEDDSDDEASWLSSEMKRSGKDGSGFDDAFAPRHGSSGGGGELGDDDEDDDWGPFVDPSDANGGGATQSFDFTLSAAGGAGVGSSSNPFAENLTPADWSAQFRREYHEEEHTGGEQDEDDSDDGEDDDEEEGEDESNAAQSKPVEAEDAQHGSALSSSPLSPKGLDASLAADVVSKAHARRPSLGHLETADLGSGDGAANRRRGSLGSAGPEISEVTDAEDPLGPGISTTVSQNEEGKLQRTLADGTTVVVPLDEVALGAGEGSSTTQ
ncbi:related to SAP155-SIT4-associating protein [Sporisorium scitamineum]|uniref:Related to SAP155-SIT4-associating protein n=1 Tax=Sporisorium scitamineum TaxID=49012 RepID=A0A127Z4A3_9BASI|nr:related to SAP155-SIT4-associating protein [Sporisorium scitamineum]